MFGSRVVSVIFLDRESGNYNTRRKLLDEEGHLVTSLLLAEQIASCGARLSEEPTPIIGNE
jgi:hypothetical protein